MTTSIDQYSICPCGNGKKIKFCKCKDSLQELDRISTMLAGGQVVPALDRINRVLEEHPDAAWALAIKGRILLDLREYDSLRENAERFVRLQPTNPLALTQRAASQVFRNEIADATESVLEALTESSGEVDSFVLEIVSVLSYALANTGQFLSARGYCSLALSADGFDGGQTAANVLRELNTSPAVSHLLKVLPPSQQRPDDAEWGERFDEALGLLRGNRIALAETKFASLARAYPGEPSILSGLLSCAIWRANATAQSETLAKLADCQQLDEDERGKWLAMSWLIDPKMPQLSVELMTLKADIDQVSEVEMAMQASPLFEQLPEQLLRNFVENEDEVAPRSAFQILDQELPAEDTPLNGETLSETLAVALVFGKQTDRAARVEVPSVQPMFLEVVRRTLSDTLGKHDWHETASNPAPFIMVSEPRAAMFKRTAARNELDQALAEFQKSRYARRLASQPLPALGGRSLKAVAGDDSLQLQRQSVLRVLENAEPICRDPDLLSEIRELAAVTPLAMINAKTSDDLEEVENCDLARVAVDQLDAEGLYFLMQRAQMLQHSSVLRRVAHEILDRGDSLNNTELRDNAYMLLIELEESPAKALELLAEAKRQFESSGGDLAALLLMELPLRARSGDPTGFQNVVRTLTSDYRDRQDVMAALQQLLVSMGLINPDGSPRGEMPRRSAAPAAEQGTGIWTPGGGSAPPAAAPESPASPAAGKLWVPGMD